MRRDLPAGTVTFLFTDVEGSTKLLHELGAEAYAEKLAEHRRIVRQACTARGGVEVDTQGDAFFVAFPTAPEALEAAQAITEELAAGLITLRIGLHTGTPLLTEEGYAGEDVHFAARVAASAHGGQVVLSQPTQALLDERYSLLDLGEHRLKDIRAPVPIFQLGRESFPPLKTISNTNLPRPASSFVGRRGELQELLARIERGARLVTLSGPGGSGKTRLALEAATTLVPEYNAGVFWVGLASIREPTLVIETIAQILGAKDGLAEHIGEREMLLLLDNLEQVIEAAPELSSLLQGCPNLTLLVTSRELLRVQGEVAYAVPPLEEAEAVTLFCDRAQTQANEGIAELCRRLDNLPLAVELAAARTSVLSPRQILERLSQRLDLLKGGRDSDARQQTLRAAIEWSNELLTEAEQRLFARLSVFAGGCTLEAAEDVADADVDTLQSLVDKSLLRFTNQRYWMLETIREYAAERLDELREAEQLRQGHAEFYLAMVAAKQGEFWGPAEAAAYNALDAERENARAALGWAIPDHPALAYRLATGLTAVWYHRSLFQEALFWTEQVLLLPAGAMVAERHRLTCFASELLMMRDEFARADALLKEALELAQQIDDPVRLAGTWTYFGHLASTEERFSDAEGFYRLALELFRSASDTLDQANACSNLGWALIGARRFKRAREVLSDGLELARAGESRLLEAAILNNLGHVALGEEQFDALKDAVAASCRIALTDREPRILAEALDLVARAAAADGDDASAARLSGAVAAIQEDIGYRVPVRRQDLLDASRARLGYCTWDSEFAYGKAMRGEEAVALALSLD